MRILLVDDHVLFREGLASLLASQPDLELVGEAGSVAGVIALARKLRPDLVLMDFGLPDGTGLDATEAILKDRPETKIVFLTFHDDDERLFAAIRKGAKGYLLKNVSTSELLSYLRGVEQGRAAITPDMTSRILEEFSQSRPPTGASGTALADLTPREVEVLRLLTTGATNFELAERLVISENTVKNHVSSILSKLNLKNRREAASFARRHGLAQDLLVH
ncbi:MAG: response regulator transcription factor [Anaerolineae bacterium]|jgi:DNA-binding NarL/FixJ family response regulator